MIGNSTHIVSGYDTELSSLTNDLTDLGALVSEMVEDAMQAFKKRDSIKAQEVIERDQKQMRYSSKLMKPYTV